ncbi:Trp biosynthesis-associated membrane protein [Pengzhenrongella frigida]|uniref:Trp biosynthesis protein n=1 Tax=Pengzhenrongella frigida TaxID=1259133 RepID=A0A4Q5N3G0_9MICO|nr:Trp biosynthesis-associated membrane protein [Cellulomonas sp. HLT2-17]RYV52686.1 Trp biosynthesis protein [Cellulomonas sp. HLT2-17]
MNRPAPVTDRREGAPSTRRRAVLVVLALALATLAAGVPRWMSTAGTSVLEGLVPVDIAGTQAAPAVPAAALALLAAAGAIGLVGRIGRWVVVAVVVGLGALLIGSALAVIADPTAVAGTQVANATGVATLAAPVTLTVAPYAAAGLGLVTILVGGWLAVTSRTWSRSSARHEAAGTTGGAGVPVPDDDQSAWDALTRGDDPS